MSLSILIIDSQVVVRRGLAQILREEFRDITLCEALDAAGAMSLIEKKSWDLVILDIRLSEESGLELLGRIRVARSDARVLVFTVYPNYQFAAQCLRFGASGYVCKDESQKLLVKAVRTLLSGKKWFPKAMLEAAGGLRSGRASADRLLSAREYDIMRMLAAGRRPSEVATQLVLSIKTVTTYKRRILCKMGWSSVADIIRYVDQTEMGQGTITQTIQPMAAYPEETNDEKRSRRRRTA